MKSVFFYLLLLLSILCFAGFAQSRDPFYPEQPIDSNNTHHFIDKTDNSETLQHQNSTLHHRIYPLQYADVTTVAQQLTNYGISLLSDHGRIAIDKDSNSLSIIDTEKAHTEISDWLKIKETPQQQVHITAHIISSSQDALNELGTQWGLLNMKSTNLEGTSNNTTTPHNIASAPLTAPSLAALALHQKTKNPLHYIAFNIA
ncbi:TPA: type IV pilus secretin PilQ, partial [Klebsiella pneumoniae]|nr:type IV pilus secretin PilQ [Klebsiella pneumoniae]